MRVPELKSLNKLQPESYRSLFEHMLNGFAYCRMLYEKGKPNDFIYLLVNPAFERLTGLKDVVGRKVSEVIPGISEADPTLLEAYDRVASTGVPEQFEIHVAALGMWFAVSVYSPAPEHFVAIFDVITERKKAEERLLVNEAALKSLNETLEQSVSERTAELREKDQILLMQNRQAAMGEMIGNIAHQWRQPLNNLGLMLQNLMMTQEMGLLTPEGLASSVQRSMELIKHMSKTIDDFGNFFKPDKEKAVFSLYEVVSRSLSLIADRLIDHNIEVVLETKMDIPVLGYQNEFAQALLNLLNNAGDALNERGVSNPRIYICIGKQEGRPFVTICDNAGGVPEEIIDKIFDPYFSTKGPQKGTGIGLFMAKNIIEKNMGGRLTVANTTDGAKFRIEI
jgi:PAS domain S-box-containing protein